MKLTDQDMLTEVVKRGLNEWKPPKYEENTTSLRRIETFSEGDREYVFISWNLENAGFYQDRFSLPDLLADHEFMKAVFGEERVCQICGSHKGLRLGDKIVCAALCTGMATGQFPFILVWQCHAIQALKLLHAGENAIKYLYDNLPSVK